MEKPNSNWTLFTIKLSTYSSIKKTIYWDGKKNCSEKRSLNHTNTFQSNKYAVNFIEHKTYSWINGVQRCHVEKRNGWRFKNVTNKYSINSITLIKNFLMNFLQFMRLLPRAIAPIIILPICSLNPSSAYCSSHSLFPLVSARARDRIHDYYCLIIFTYWFLISKQKEHWPDTSASNLPNEWMNKIGFVLVSCWYSLDFRAFIYIYLIRKTLFKWLNIVLLSNSAYGHINQLN